MMTLTFLISALAMNVAYIVLAFIALRHLTTPRKGDPVERLLAVTLWWPFYGGYDSVGEKLATFGRILLPLCVGAYVLWGLQITSQLSVG